MLDYIYRPSNLCLPSTISIIHAATTQLPNAQSILWRRAYIAKHIKSAIKTNHKIRILSVACGHMRELDVLSTHDLPDNVEFLALDQDVESINECLRSYPRINITPANVSIHSLFNDGLSGAPFCLIYSAGLSDYLTDKKLGLLIAQLFSRLEDDGLLTIGNFTPDSHGRGFVEGFMDWSLIYRDEADLRRIVENALPHASITTFRDDPGNVAYIEIRRLDGSH
jgi:extracellular factor (EF) 3-hydroxypalmitic acid methyl ester biosynthesis protein